MGLDSSCASACCRQGFASLVDNDSTCYYCFGSTRYHGSSVDRTRRDSGRTVSNLDCSQHRPKLGQMPLLAEFEPQLRIVGYKTPSQHFADQMEIHLVQRLLSRRDSL